MMRFSVSVCIATYNGESFILEQLNSILPQLKEEDEVIISDDYSTDSTILLINSIGDSRIRIVYNQNKRGYTSNFENALKEAKNDIIFLCDQDDIWHISKVDRCLMYLEYADIVVSDATLINNRKKIIADSFFAVRNPYKSFVGNLIKFGYLGCCMAFKKKVLDKSLPFPEKANLCTHDNWLFLVGQCFFKMKIVDDKLIFYRRHSSNTSSGGLSNSTTLYFKMKYRFYLLYSLIKRR